MAAQSQRRNDTYDRGGYAQVQGNTVRKQAAVPDYAPDRGQPPRKRPNTAVRKNRDKAGQMNLGYVLFLASALIASGMILTVYLGLQSDITNSIKQLARLERQLNTLKQANDEEYSRVSNSVDLEEIKRIAIQELGMGYAQEGQIIDFAGSKNDYVRQVAGLPD